MSLLISACTLSSSVVQPTIKSPFSTSHNIIIIPSYSYPVNPPQKPTGMLPLNM